jgi:hypothetical protein
MNRKKPAPDDVIRGGSRFSEQIMLKKKPGLNAGSPD